MVETIEKSCIQNWQTRPISWDDVNFSIRQMYSHVEHPAAGERKLVYRPVRKTNGDNCYQISLKLCSFVHYECWIPPQPNDEPSPATKAYMLLKLQQRLRKVVNALRTYERH
jgi:hypothetical protein